MRRTGVEDLGAAAIVEGHVQHNAAVVARHFKRVPDLPLQVRVNTLQPPAVDNPHAVAIEVV